MLEINENGVILYDAIGLKTVTHGKGNWASQSFDMSLLQ